jgi:hypothetical protein
MAGRSGPPEAAVPVRAESRQRPRDLAGVPRLVASATSPKGPMQSTQAITASRAVRTDLGALGVLGLAVFMLTVAVLFTGYRLAVPSDGGAGGYVTTGWTADGMTVASARRDSPLQAGDVVTSVNGVPLSTWLSGAPGITRPALRAGDSLSYTVVRNGEVLTLAVPMTGYPLADVLLANWGTLLWLGLMVLVATYLFLRRPASSWW